MKNIAGLHRSSLRGKKVKFTILAGYKTNSEGFAFAAFKALLLSRLAEATSMFSLIAFKTEEDTRGWNNNGYTSDGDKKLKALWMNQVW